MRANDIQPMPNKIILDVNHPSKDRMEYFLNSVNEKLEHTPYDWRGLKESENIVGGDRFQSEDNAVTITVIFLESYNAAKVIANANGFTLLPTAKWSQNGNVMYFVESPDTERVSEILSHFAGRE